MNNFLQHWNINFLCFWLSMIQKYHGPFREHPLNPWLYIILKGPFQFWKPVNSWVLWGSVRFSTWKSVPFSLFLGELLFLGCVGNPDGPGYWAQDKPKWHANVRVATSDRRFMVTVVGQSYRGLGYALAHHSPALSFFTALPILRAVNLSLYLQPQQGAHFHRREDSFNKSSSFVQE